VNAVERWGGALGGWGIPEEILARAPESPWIYPTELFRRRAEAALITEPTPSVLRAAESLPRGGTVLDVGVGAGAASLPLARRASRITGVDASEDMLEAFRQAATDASVEAAAVLGRWPDVAGDVGPADVVVCGHVLYNVQDLAPFARALDGHARDRVVLEITATHPLAWMSDLWLRFHGLERPTRPTVDDAEEALRELGFDVHTEEVTRPPRTGGFPAREDAVSLVRRRLCLPPDRDQEIASALGDRLVEHDGLWSAGPTDQAVVTLWWDTAR